MSRTMQYDDGSVQHIEKKEISGIGKPQVVCYKIWMGDVHLPLHVQFGDGELVSDQEAGGVGLFAGDFGGDGEGKLETRNQKLE